MHGSVLSLVSGKPFSIERMRMVIVVSADVSLCTCSQVSGWYVWRVEVKFSKSESSIPAEVSVSSVAMPAMSVDGMCTKLDVLQSVSAWASSELLRAGCACWVPR